MSEDASRLPPGTVLAGRYRIERVLGQGGMGAVYEAVRIDLDRRVALKLLDQAASAPSEALAATEREARASAKLAHPHIVQVIDFHRGDDGEMPFFVMELLEGESLDARLRRRGALDPGTAALVMVQVLSALGAAHAHDILHRDVKPANVFLTPTAAGFDFVKLLDFGIAGNLTGHASTRTPGVAGTPAYMAPEQIRGEALDARTDLWAAGVCLHEMLSGNLPFEGHSIASLLANICLFAPPPLVGIDPALVAIVARALAKEPKDRFASADEMRAALAPLAAVGAVPSRDLVGPKTRVLERAETVPQLGSHPESTVSLAETVRDPSADERALHVSTRGLAGNTLASGAAHTLPQVAPPSPARSLLVLLNVTVATAAVGATAFLLAPRASTARAGAEETRPRCAFAPPVTWKVDIADLRLASDGATALLVATSKSGTQLEVASLAELDRPFEPWEKRTFDQQVAPGERILPCAMRGAGLLAGGVRTTERSNDPHATFLTTPQGVGSAYPAGISLYRMPREVVRTVCTAAGSLRLFASVLRELGAPDETEVQFFANDPPALRQSYSSVLSSVRAIAVAAASDAIAVAVADERKLGVGFMDRVALDPSMSTLDPASAKEVALVAAAREADIVWRATKAPELRWARFDRDGKRTPMTVLVSGDVFSPSLASSEEGYTLAWAERSDGRTWVRAGTGATPAIAARDASTFAVPASTRNVVVGPGRRPWIAWIEGDVAQVSRLACVR